MENNFRARTICFTHFINTVDDCDPFLLQLKLKCEWYLAQVEECPETHRLHIQGMAHCDNVDRWTFLKKNKCHIEKCIDPIKSIQYCSKEDTRIAGPFEHGTRPTFNVKGQKAANAQRNKLLLETPTDILVKDGIIKLSELPNIIKAKNMWSMVDPGTPKEKEANIWLYGFPGCGKTRWAKETYSGNLYEKAMNKWWDGFKGEDYVLLDDFDKQGKCLGHYLKIWGDRYFGWKGETKGGTIQPNFKRFIITSNYSIDQIFGGPEGDSELVAAIERRFIETCMDSQGNFHETNKMRGGLVLPTPLVTP